MPTFNAYVAAAVAPAFIAAASPAAIAARAFTIEDANIGESSGLAMSSYEKTQVITHNDSGGQAAYYLVDTRTGATVLRVGVPGATNVDWEDIAVAGHTVYLADIGDNRATRSSVTIYSVEESRSESGPPRASRTTLTYDDGPRDAEALLVSPDGATRYVVSKQVIGAGVYRVEGTVLRHVGDLRAGLVTGGSWSPDGRRIALVTYGAIWVYDAATWPGGTPERLDLPPLGQAESIAWDGDGALLVGSEGVHAPVYRLNLARAATPNPAGTATATPAPSPSPTKPTTQPAPATEPTVTGAGNGWTKALAVGAVLLVFGGIAEARARRRRNGGVG